MQENLDHKDDVCRCQIVDQSAYIRMIVLLLAKVQAQQDGIQAFTSRYDSNGVLLE